MSDHHSRRILVCVTGLTPQVVTETVYALAQQVPSWIPTEVHVLTTVTGAQRARLLLLAEDRAQFRRLCDEYDLHDVAFDDSHIHLLRDTNGEPLEDIRTQADNMAMADAILAAIAGFAADPDSAIHVSLAGGRKSMGFFAGYALSLYGRPQDRLSHVLVSPGFETNPEFFYPPRQPRVLIGRTGEPLSTADAQVELADIPFVRLRDRLPPELLAGGRFVDAVAAAQRLQQPPRLRLVPATRRVVCADVEIPLSPANFAVYAWHADRRRRGLAGVRLADFDAVGSPLRADLNAFGRLLYPNEITIEGTQWRERPWDDDGMDHVQWLSERRSRINAAIRNQLGKDGLTVYGIASTSTRGRQSVHALKLPGSSIEFVG